MTESYPVGSFGYLYVTDGKALWEIVYLRGVRLCGGENTLGAVFYEEFSYYCNIVYGGSNAQISHSEYSAL
jgi:hypothetical protein